MASCIVGREVFEVSGLMEIGPHEETICPRCKQRTDLHAWGESYFVFSCVALTCICVIGKPALAGRRQRLEKLKSTFGSTLGRWTIVDHLSWREDHTRAVFQVTDSTRHDDAAAVAKVARRPSFAFLPTSDWEQIANEFDILVTLGCVSDEFRDRYTRVLCEQLSVYLPPASLPILFVQSVMSCFPCTSRILPMLVDDVILANGRALVTRPLGMSTFFYLNSRHPPNSCERIHILHQWAQTLFPGLDELKQQQRLIHNDIRPSNLIVVDNAGPGRPCLIDFGMSFFLTTQTDTKSTTVSDRHSLYETFYLWLVGQEFAERHPLASIFSHPFIRLLHDKYH